MRTPNVNAPINQGASGFVNGIPHGFPYHSHAGGIDTSGSVVRRLFGMLFGGRLNFTPYVDTRANQPTAGAMTNAYKGHYVGAQTYIGDNAIACGAPPDPFQPGMLYMPVNSFPVTGLGGLINGEMLGQSLLEQQDNPNQ